MTDRTVAFRTSMSSNYRDHLQLLAFGFQSHIISLNLENSTGVIGKLQEPCKCAKSFKQEA